MRQNETHLSEAENDGEAVELGLEGLRALGVQRRQLFQWQRTLHD